MAVPKYDELMKPLLVAVQDGEVHRIQDIAVRLAKQMKLSAKDLAERLPSERQSVFKNRVGWAKTYLKKAGLLDSPVRATIMITDAGKQVVAENPEKIDVNYLKRFPSFKKFISGSAEAGGGNAGESDTSEKDHTPDEQLEEAYQQIHASLASDLLDEVLKISPKAFEKFVVDLLSQMGYGTVAYGSHVTPYVGDDGIDGVIMEDKLGFSLIYLQAKEWARDRVVGQPEIQGFVGAITGKHGDGLFVTTAKFSKKARAFAEMHHIILIDGQRLANLMIEHNFCVATRKTYALKAMDTDMLAEYQGNGNI